MPGIADVQPKAVGVSPSEMVGAVEPAATQTAVIQLADSMRRGMITAQDVVSHALDTQAKAEALSPEMVQARRESAQLAIQKSQAERETMLSKDFVNAYLRYNLPLKKDDGTPDYSGMAEVGQKYADMERLVQYAEMGLKGTPTQFKDAEGNTRTVLINPFGEEVTYVPGGKNPLVEKYQKMLQTGRSFLLQNDKEPSIPEGETRKIEVLPKHIEGPPITPGPAPARAAVGAPESNVVQARDWLAANKLIPAASAADISDQEALAAYQGYQKAAPVVAPKTPSDEKPMFVPGTGLLTEFGAKGDDLVKDMRAQELYKNWAEKSAKIDELRSLEAAYQQNPKVTKQLDLDLAQAALFLGLPSAGGGRGMPEMRVASLSEAQPLIEKAYHIVPQLLGKESFTPETRARLIAAAERKAQALEGTARSAIQTTHARISKMGQSPAKYLDEKELGLLTPRAPAASAVGGTIKLPSGVTLNWTQ